MRLGAALLFATSAFDAIYVNAALQHVADAPAVLREARRVAKPGAVIGIGDTDWGTRIMHPHGPLLDRGQKIQESVRDTGNVRVGRELRGLRAGAGFEQIELAAEGRVVGSAVALQHMARSSVHGSRRPRSLPTSPSWASPTPGRWHRSRPPGHDGLLTRPRAPSTSGSPPSPGPRRVEMSAAYRDRDDRWPAIALA